MVQKTPDFADRPLTFDEVFRRERKFVSSRRDALGLEDIKNDLTAICLSGGGVRSASFCLGVMRALARAEHLKSFDYMSTVSGGGFAGAFVTRWVYEKGYHCVEAKLKDDQEFSVDRSPLEHVRNYISYLTPRVGLFSLDSISGFGLVLRNLLINWLIIVPLIIAALLVPQIFLTTFKVYGNIRTSLPYFCVVIGIALAGMAISESLNQRPGWSSSAGTTNLPSLFKFYSLPFFVATLLLTFATVKGFQFGSYPWEYGARLLFCILVVAFFQQTITARSENRLTLSFSSLSAPKELFSQLIMLLPNLVTFMVQAIVLVGLLILAQQLAQKNVGQNGGNLDEILVIGTPLAICSSLYLSEVIYVALRGDPPKGDMEREWLARSTGILFGPPILWFFISFIAIEGPSVFSGLFELVNATYAASAGASAVGISGLLLAWFTRGQTAISYAKQGLETWKQWGTRWTLALLLPIFIFLTLIMLSRFTLWLVQQPIGWADSNSNVIAVYPEPQQYIGYQLLALFVVLFIGVLMDWRVAINRFSLHSMYRNRIIRTFLGASNFQRRSGNFFDFDENDNVSLCKLDKPATTKPADDCLIALNSTFVGPQFHIINMALNVPASADLALQERKALPFSASAHSIGSCKMKQQEGELLPVGCYRDASQYAKGRNNTPLTLGTAIAISGAAFDPQMGYHGSAPLGLLLTLFNLRLGAWFGNTNQAGSKTFKQDGPEFSALLLFQEAFGRATENKPFVHLSDGGHFDNLGLYEMLMRRCKLIVVVDAGCDPGVSLADFAIAQRIAALDNGTKITMNQSQMAKISAKKASIAEGRIEYPPIDKKINDALKSDRENRIPNSYPQNDEGTLIYVKPCVSDDDQALVSAYHNANAQFPHEPTTEQWFNESQFSAYMKLAERISESIDLSAHLPKLK